MAIMNPEIIDSQDSTYSEREFFYALKSQLDSSIFVFYGVNWITFEGGLRKMSETDFLIYDPHYGYITIEVKGGSQIRREGNNWSIMDEYGERALKKSPYDQAEQNMYYFLKYYAQQYNYPYKGVYGYAAAYPNYTINNPELLDNRPKVITLDINDMNNLSNRIREIFLFWRGERKINSMLFTTEQQYKFIQLVNKRIAISAAAGSLIKLKSKQLEIINRVQDNYIHFMSNFKHSLIEGGAGTGKTWIAIKICNNKSLEGKKVLFTCKSNDLVNTIRENVKDEVLVLTTDEIIHSEVYQTNSETKSNYSDRNISGFDVIVIDEAQDLSIDEIRNILSKLVDLNRSEYYLFKDDTQKIHDINENIKTFFNQPSFLLHENLRNTASIYQYAKEKTNLGIDVVTNPIIGPKPELIEIHSSIELINRLIDLLRNLIDREYVEQVDITLLIDDSLYYKTNIEIIDRWYTADSYYPNQSEIKCFPVSRYKGLESNVIIYIRPQKQDKILSYIAYTRARFYLYEVIYYE